MTNNTTVCDLCSATSPVADKHANGFVTLNVQFAGPTKLKPLMNGSDNFVDFCKECFESFLKWATDHRAAHVPPVEPISAAPQPAPVVTAGTHVVLTEPPASPITVVDPNAEHAAEPAHDPAHDAPAAHEESHA